MPKADWPSMCLPIHCRLGSSASASYLWERDRKAGGEVELNGKEQGGNATLTTSLFQPSSIKAGRTQLMGGREES